MTLRRIERLLSEARISSNTQDKDVITDDFLTLYANRVQSMIEDKIFLSNSANNIFMASTDITIAYPQLEYPLPFDIYARNAIKSVNVVRLSTYGFLNDKVPFISESENGNKYGYSLKENLIVLNLQRNISDPVRVNYDRKIPTVGKRFGLVSAVTSTTMTIPTTTSPIPLISDIDDFYSLVDINGVIVARNIRCISHVDSTGVVTYSDGIYIITPSKIIQNIKYTAISNSVVNNPSIAYTDTVTAGSEVVTVTGNAISIAIQSGVSTETQIRLAILLSTQAMALIIPSLLVQPSKVMQDLTYYVSSVSSASVYDVSYTDTAIFNTDTEKWVVAISIINNSVIVAIKSGITTALEIASALNSSSAFITYLSVKISGTSSNAQVSSASTIIGAAQVAASALLLTTSAIGTYVIPGKYATSHSQLPDECEKIFLEVLERRIAQRQSQTDTMSIIAPLTAQEEKLIDDVFAKGSDDNLVPPIVDYVEFS
jgi:hypothetical protein